jgi:hypothetical protein
MWHGRSQVRTTGSFQGSETVVWSRVADEIIEMAELPDPLSDQDVARWHRLVAAWLALTGDRDERRN